MEWLVAVDEEFGFSVQGAVTDGDLDATRCDDPAELTFERGGWRCLD